MSQLRNMTTGAVLASNVRPAKTFWRRTIGLIGQRTVTSNEGLWIDQCSIVHTMGMHVPIDILFIDRQGYVLRIARSVKPNTSYVACALAHSVVETGAAGDLGHDVLVGDQLALV
jgi:uncharacterized membrane protein (UPF0127 family)